MTENRIEEHMICGSCEAFMETDMTDPDIVYCTNETCMLRGIPFRVSELKKRSKK